MASITADSTIRTTDGERPGFTYTPALMLTVFMLMIGGFIVLASASMAIPDRGRSSTGLTAETQEQVPSPMNSIRKQLVYCSIGIVMAFVAYLLPHRVFKSHTLFWVVAAMVIGMLAMVYVIPGEANAAKSVDRWVRVPVLGLTIQPSEPAKLGIIVMVAIWAYLNPQRIQNPFDFRGLLTPGLVIGVVLGLIFLEPDYATTLICGSIAMATFFIAGASIRWITLALVLLIGVVGFTVTQKVGERSARINAWKNFWTSENQALRDENRQQLASVKAIASGQLLGKGLGLGSAKLGSLSEHDSDFIFAVVAEEFGFIGSLSMLLGFVFILYAGTSISINSKDLFGRVLAMGIVTMISVQVVLNLATTTALVPNTGLTLPFFSKGGSSLIIMLVSMGLLMGVERETRAPLKPSTTDLLPENSRASDNPFAS